MKHLLLVALLLCHGNLYSKSIAFLGDSISTGGGAHPDLIYSLESFRGILSGQSSVDPDQRYRDAMKAWGYAHDGNDKPVRLPLSRREYHNAAAWVIDNLWLNFGSQFLDSEEYSWSYLFGSLRGMPARNLYIAARDGDRIADLRKQVDRLLDYTNGQIPDEVFVLFTGNDLCGPSIEYATASADYKSAMLDGLKYLSRNGTAQPRGSNVYIVDPLGSLQIVNTPEILNKQVSYNGHSISCKQLQTRSFEPKTLTSKEPTDDPEIMVQDMMFNMLVNSPGAYCNTLFSVASGDTEMQMALSNRIIGYRKANAEVFEELNNAVGSEIQFRHLKSTRDVIFSAEDIGNDCFHLSLQGHHRVAQAIFKELQEPVKIEKEP